MVLVEDSLNVSLEAGERRLVRVVFENVDIIGLPYAVSSVEGVVTRIIGGGKSFFVIEIENDTGSSIEAVIDWSVHVNSDDASSVSWSTE